MLVADSSEDPYAGPSWDQVPSVASLGGGVRSDAGPKSGQLLDIVADAIVDARCAAILISSNFMLRFSFPIAMSNHPPSETKSIVPS